MRILAIDPGPTESAFVLYEDGRILDMGKESNFDLLARLHGNFGSAGVLAIEMIASYGMAVGAEVFETCVWIGRFAEAFGEPWSRVYRKDVKMHLCHDSRAKDPNIRQALLDKFGPQGTKKAPGALYGVKKDIWSALACAVVYDETRRLEAAS